MWKCSNCKEQIEDKYEFCWKCGLRNINVPLTQAQEEFQKEKELGVPSFYSIDELAPPPQKHKESLNEKIGWPIVDAIIGAILTVTVVPIIRFVFGAYGLYISIAFIALVVIFIVWKVFRGDPSEGKGLGLGP